MAFVNSIDVHHVEKLSAEISNTGKANWINFRFDDFRVTCFARSAEQELRFVRIASAIELINAEFDERAERAEAERRAAERRADAEIAFGADQ